MSMAQHFDDPSLHPAVRGFLHQPANSNGNGLVFTHGAGGNASASLLVTLAETFASAGFTVLRCDLPFRQSRAFGPPRPADAARDREGLKNAVIALRKQITGRLFLGGQSYGGRQATMLCAAEPDLADGLVLTSYPLHPPGNSARPRTEHFPQLRTSGLFVQGARDPFATIEEISEALKLIPAKTRLISAEGVGHDLGFKGKKGNTELAVEVLAVFREMFRSK